MRRRWMLFTVLVLVISLTTIVQAKWLPITEERYFTDNIERVDVQSNNVDLFIQEATEAKKALVQLSGPEEQLNLYTFHVTLRNGHLVVNVKAKVKKAASGDDVKLLIQLPKRKLAQLNITTKTGAIIVQGMENERATIETTNGRIVVKDLYVDESLRLVSRDGDISAKDVKGYTVTIQAAKGDILVNNVRATVKDVHTVGGELIQS